MKIISNAYVPSVEDWEIMKSQCIMRLLITVSSLQQPYNIHIVTYIGVVTMYNFCLQYCPSAK